MDRIRQYWEKYKSKPHREEYEPLAEQGGEVEESALLGAQDEVPFSWSEYLLFAWLGMAMLWAWNMFLAATPYFQIRFQADLWIQQNFQSAILSVSTLTNLTAMLILTNIQYSASYPFRINLALILNTGIFSLLTASTSMFLDVSPGAYLAFILIMVASSSWATGLIQNGAFAFAASFGRPEYMQALMAGQGVAGVLPPIAQVITVLAVPEKDGMSPADEIQSSSSSAFVYFLAAVAVSVSALVAFIPLVRRHNHIIESRMVDRMAESMTSVEEAERAARKVVSPLQLLKKLHWLSGAIFMCFAVAMFFPVFTGKIVSVRYPGDEKSPAGALFRPAAFIPLAFFAWNLGDLSGRMSTILPFSLRHRPAALFGVSLARLGFLPMYLLCNIGGRGAVISSDLFYLFVVQFLFGLTTGWLGSSCMMAAGEWVEDGEREATGGFMGLCLVAGLTTGSLLSFTAGGI
ncbi:nucleoside transporter family [Colletotrichum truncatum]|uniref:Nucleoside transporter family n=1 Tax=Colletotrichum truncatum TaxID=5467 RepID=A0ACC3YJ59_COLTU|nr:nucleoside transporter family [Colletotrichum truncatum]KAF6797162.1 nucleoside transporter family [Colletotrichum truncatum]